MYCTLAQRSLLYRMTVTVLVLWLMTEADGRARVGEEVHMWGSSAAAELPRRPGVTVLIR